MIGGGPGYQRLWGWFGLSYASFLTLPRVLMHDMPDDWQDRMATLLEEYDAAYPNCPEIGTTVRATHPFTGKLAKMPQWILNYRHPDMGEIAVVRMGSTDTTPRDGGETGGET